MSKLKIIFMGTPDFAVPSLEKIYVDNDIDLLFVITKEDKASGRGKEIHESDVKRKTKELNQKYNRDVKIFTPHKIKEDRELIEKMKAANPDFIIVVAYGQILSKEILDIPTKACVNGHASILPKYRGSSPIQGAILAGEKETGTTTMLMSEGMDEGDILLTKKIPIERDDTAESMFDKLSIVTADALIETIKNFDDIKAIPQDSSKATYVKMIKKEDGLIDCDKECADEIDRKVRAYYPWPGAFVKDENGKMVKIFKVKKCEGVDCENVINDGKSGGDFDNKLNGENFNKLNGENFGSKKILYKYGKDKLIMKVKDGYLEILDLQAEGKKRMLAKDFINGMKN